MRPSNMSIPSTRLEIGLRPGRARAIAPLPVPMSAARRPGTRSSATSDQPFRLGPRNQARRSQRSVRRRKPAQPVTWRAARRGPGEVAAAQIVRPRRPRREKPDSVGSTSEHCGSPLLRSDQSRLAVMARRLNRGFAQPLGRCASKLAMRCESRYSVILFAPIELPSLSASTRSSILPSITSARLCTERLIR